jgi:hypothetical protein
MATISTFKKSGNGDSMVSFVSDLGLVADTIDMDGLDPSYAHCFLGIQLVDAGGLPVLGGAGSVAVTVYTANNNQGESPATSVIPATAPITVNWSGNTTRVTVVPTGITTAISYRVVLTANKS